MDSTPKILFVDHNLDFSGSVVSMSYLVKGFVRNNFRVIVLSKLGDRGRTYFESLGAEAIFYSNSNLKSISLSFHISDKTKFLSIQWIKNLVKDILYFFNGIILSVKIINKIKPDLIYINEYVAIQFVLYARIKSIPVVVHIRSLFIDQKYNLRIFLLKKVLQRLTSLNIAITSLEASQIGKWEKIKYKTLVIPEFLDDSDFEVPKNTSKIKSKFNINITDKVVLFLGGISEIKGTKIFLDAINKIPYSNVKFFVAGPIKNYSKSKIISNYYTHCIELINSMKRTHSIELLGNVNNVTELISISDVLVSCSTKTHFSRPIIEAWAQSKAVIASDILHNRELVTHNVNGILYPADDSNSLAKAIKELLYDDQLRLHLGMNGLKTAKDKYYSATNFSKIFDACRKLLN